MRQEAVDVVRQLIEAYPNRSDPLVLMGDVCSEQGNADGAIEWWEKCLELNPDREDARRSIGELMSERGLHNEAVELLRKAVELGPGSPLAHDSLGHALIRQGHADQAIAVLEKGAELAPEESRSHLSLAKAYLQTRRYNKARASYEGAIAMKPDVRSLPSAYYGLSTACARLGLAEEAAKYRKEFKRARAAHREANLEWRRSSYNETILQRRALSETCSHVGELYMAYGNPAKAERLLLRAAELDRENTQCRMKLVILYTQSSNRSRALEICEQIRAVEPTNALNYLSIGFIHQRMKRPDDAERAFKKVIQFAPERPEGHTALAKLYMQTNRKLPEAKVLAARAADLNPNGANYFVLSEACRKCGDTAGRLEALKRAVEMEPRNVDYMMAYELLRKLGS